MRTIGYCERCRKFRTVTIAARNLMRNRLIGVCDECTTPSTGHPARPGPPQRQPYSTQPGREELVMTNPTPDPAQPTRAADLRPAGDPDCPVQVGDKVTPRHTRHVAARVVYVHTGDDALTTCFVETPGGIRYLTYPWRLAPADPAVDRTDWQARMDRFREIQRDRVRHRFQQRQLQAMHHLTVLTRQLEAIATAVRTADLPGTAVIDDEPWRAEFTATELDEEFRQLAEYRETVLEAELFTAEEFPHHLAHPLAPPAPPAPAEDTGRGARS
ncbi:hypothetical protein [Nocardia wallacei]|uniref:hypothetical protein n=1 Tax=Nocardia wallacei TaxID=480035 RepID=UPI002457DAF6|nr:hypothetical protein [Nocardia wallacei]